MKTWSCFWPALAALAQVSGGPAQNLPNLCPNPSVEEGQGDAPAGWSSGQPGATWAEGEAREGKRSLKITCAQAGPTIGWTSSMIPRTPGQQFVLTVHARLDGVTGGNGAFIGLYHTDEKGERIGQSAGLVLGGSGPEVATTPWQRYVAMSEMPPEVKGVRVNVRLYGAAGTVWFDDIRVTEVKETLIERPRPLRRGLRLETGKLAIVDAREADGLAAAIAGALKTRGVAAPVLPEDTDLAQEKRDLIVLGNLATSRAAAWLYCRMLTSEDRWFPGDQGLVLRPLIDPLGTGANLLVVAGSTAAGQKAAVTALLERRGAAAGVFDCSLTIVPGGRYRGAGYYPWIGGAGRREMAPATRYLRGGDPAEARAYRELVLKTWLVPDQKLFGDIDDLHLYYVTKMQSWDLMEAEAGFTDEERLKLTNQLLKIMRSSQGSGYAGLRAGLYPRENHATRAASGFYYGWRYFHKYYAEELGQELDLWREKLKGFWSACFATSRSFEDSLSQHALGGSLENTLDIAFQEPDWSADFFASGRARQMGERCLAISNNLGQTVLLGDTGAGDYATSVFSKLAWKLNDGRYWFMVAKRGNLSTSTDEPLRGFDAGVVPEVPRDHLGVAVVPADELYFTRCLRHTEGVPLERAFDKLTMRNGFAPADDYLMLDGVAGGSHSYDDANSLGEFSAGGRRWLCEIDIFNGPTMSHHNAVTVARDGLGPLDVPQAAELLVKLSGDGYGYTATRLPNYNGVGWTRHLVWRPGRFVLAIDEMIADQPGDYAFGLGWRSLGEPELKPGRFESRQDERSLPPGTHDGAALAAGVAKSSGEHYRHLGDYNALFFRADGVDDFLETRVSVPREGDYEVRLTGLTYTGRGIVQVSLDGAKIGEPVDLYGDAQPATVTTVLGRARLTAGEHRVRFTVVGKQERSDGYTVGLAGLDLVAPGETARAEVKPNRFSLLFPPDVPATLERDRETLGKYLPPNKHHEPVLNILEQGLSRRLEPGASACFVNLFYARAGAELTECELRRLNDHCALVRDGGELALIGAGTNGATAELGAWRVSGRFFYLSSQRRVLHEATLTRDGAAGEPGAALAGLLEAAWVKAGTQGAAAAPAWAKARELKPARAIALPAEPLSVAVRRVDGARLAVGLSDGRVLEHDATGKVTGNHAAGAAVHALEPADLDGDGREELLVGSDDEHLTALGADLKPVWDITVPFLAEEQHWSWWTLGSSKVRALRAADLDGDRRPEILAGVGNMRLHCYDARGRERWRFRADHGIPTTIAVAEVYAPGQPVVVAGNGLTSSNGSVWLLGPAGKLLGTLFNDSWCTSLPALAVGDLDGDGRPTVFCGNNRGTLRAYAPGRGAQREPLWLHNLVRPLRSLTVAGKLLVAGGDSGYLCAFDQAGEKVWGVGLSGPVTATALVRSAEPVIAVGCKDGHVFLVSPAGKLLARVDCGRRLGPLTVADLDGDGRDEIVVSTVGPDTLMIIRPIGVRP